MKTVIVLFLSLCLAGAAWGDRSPLLDQADALFNQARYDEAIAAYQEILRAEPKHDTAAFQLGRAYAAKGRYEDALAVYRQILREGVDHTLVAAVYKEMGVVYGKIGQYDQAIAALQTATNLRPDDPNTRYALGAAYMQQGQFCEAVVAFQKGLTSARRQPSGGEIVFLFETTLRELKPFVKCERPEYYSLTVRATPADSRITLPQHSEPYRPGMRLAPGRYNLLVERPGYETERRVVEIGHTDVVVDINLNPARYALTVRATPADSHITLPHHSEPYRPGMRLAPGRYDLLVERPGYETERRVVEIAKTDVVVDIDLHPSRYALTVRASPADSHITLPHHSEPYRPGMRLAPGRYDLLVERPGHQAVYRMVTIQNSDVTLDVVLAPLRYALTVRATPADSRITLPQQSEPYRPGIRLAPGYYDVLVERESYETVRRVVEIRNTDVVVDITLNPARYALTVRASPADSRITLPQYREPYRPGIRLAPGYYDVLVEREGYATERRTIRMQDADVVVNVSLAKLPDQSPPVITLTSHDITGVVEVEPETSQVTIRGYVSDDSGVREVTMNGQKVILDKQNNFVHDLYLESDHMTVVITAMDIHNMGAYQILTLQRRRPQDTTPPKIDLLSSPIVSEARTTILGRALDPSGITAVTVNDLPAVLEKDGIFKAEVVLQAGDNEIIVSAVDRHHNTGRQTFIIHHKPAQRRIALVIGNSKYQEARPLRNPRNDATDMAQVLKRLGFKVTLLRDATQRRMEETIVSFSRELRQGGVGLFYYAGHGVQVNGQNYLIPVDARLLTALDTRYKAVAVGWIFELLKTANNGTNIVILDACRNNPFADKWESSQRGLAVVQAVPGSLIAYATAPGTVAQDGTGRNGMYTKHLLRHIAQPGMLVEQMFKRVRSAVEKETRGTQIPWETSSLKEDFSFIEQAMIN